ncbi:MAG: TerB N-terminal domain-containing protein [Thermoguttaceae bacterium]|nr:TerB N-terminal domain-containing protein [Thermoguttaceae bacterium]
MRLSELTDYAAQRYGIKEEFKWDAFPGFSVLTDPRTGRWAALLMRLRDEETGETVERCDIKCGQRTLSTIRAPFVTLPFRMSGYRWVGVAFDESTDPEIVFSLFERALQSDSKSGYTIRLSTPSDGGGGLYRETPLSTVGPPPLSKRTPVPEKIVEMKKRFGRQEYSQERNARQFYLQAKFMEDYEDDAVWTEDFLRYYPTYNDLSLRQLRGYFGWRTRIRKGIYEPIATSMAYIYIYELLCGVGAATPEETLEKMKTFEAGYLKSGIGEMWISANLRRWMFEYAVIHSLPVETSLAFANPDDLEKDAHLSVLKDPKSHTDEEIFNALVHFGKRAAIRTAIYKQGEEKAKHLFAEIWRHLSETCRIGGKNFFTACFGNRCSYRWYPLSNAVYWEENPVRQADYDLTSCRSFRCRDGQWFEKRYADLHFHRNRFLAVIREADRIFRKRTKSGHYLKEKPEDLWAAPFIEEVFDAEDRARAEAARPVVTLSLSEIEHVRRDAAITRERLLTEEETDGLTATSTAEEIPPVPEETRVSPAEADESSAAPDGLDEPHTAVLTALVEGKSPADRIRAERLIPSVVTDRINEALFDRIGDNILECDGNTITLVEDYREDIKRILKGETG